MCFQAPDASQSEASVVSDGCSSPSGVAVEQLLDTRSPVRDLVTTGDAETQVSEHHLTWYVRSQYASIAECSVRAKALSEGMAHKAAASGLTFKHLAASHRRKGRHGLASLFNDSTAGFVRVTKSNRIIDSVNDYLTK